MFKNNYILINDYLCTLKKNIWFDIFTPLLIAIALGGLMFNHFLVLNKSFIVSLLSVLGIFAGFSLTAISIMTATNTTSIDKLKKTFTDKTIDGLKVSVFRLFYIMVSYSVLISLFTIILNTIACLIPWSKINAPIIINMLKIADIALILHIFFLNIRNITHLYFIYFQDTNK